jgi:hypothetical protein
MRSTTSLNLSRLLIFAAAVVTGLAIVSPAQAARAPRVTTPVLASPGSGVADSEIEAVYLLLDYEYGLGGAVYPVSTPYLLLKNGKIYRDLTVPPRDLDVTKSQSVEPKKWGTWRRSGSKLTAAWSNGKTSNWDTQPAAVAAHSGQKINGSFKSIGGGGNTALGGTTMTVSANGITFSPDGRFSLATFKAGSSSSSGVGTTTSSQRNRSGTYRLDGYAIDMTFDDGRTQRAFFCFFPNKDDYFQLGECAYSPVKQ